MISENQTPINNETTNIFLNNGGGILIAVLIIVLAALIGVTILYILKRKERKSESENNNVNLQPTDTEENQILLQYRKLNEQEKQLIKDTLTTLNNKSKNN